MAAAAATLTALAKALVPVGGEAAGEGAGARAATPPAPSTLLSSTEESTTPAPANSSASTASSRTVPPARGTRSTRNNTRKRKAYEAPAETRNGSSGTCPVQPTKRRNRHALSSRAKLTPDKTPRTKTKADQAHGTPQARASADATASTTAVVVDGGVPVTTAVTGMPTNETAGTGQCTRPTPTEGGAHVVAKTAATAMPTTKHEHQFAIAVAVPEGAEEGALSLLKKDKGKQVDRSDFGESLFSPGSPQLALGCGHYQHDLIDESPLDDLPQDADADEDEVLGNWWIFYPDRRLRAPPEPRSANPELSVSTAAVAYATPDQPSVQPANLNSSAGAVSAYDAGAGGDEATEEEENGVKHTDELFVCDMRISLKAQLNSEEAEDCEVVKVYKLNVSRPKIENDRYAYQYGGLKKENVVYELPSNFWISRIESQEEDLPDVTHADFSHLEFADPYMGKKVKPTSSGTVASYGIYSMYDGPASERQDSDGFVIREERHFSRSLFANYMLYVRKSRRLVPFEAHTYPQPEHLGDTARRFFRAAVRPYDPDVGGDGLYNRSQSVKDLRTLSIYLRSKLLNQAIRQGANIKHVASALADHLSPVISGKVAQCKYFLSDTISEPEKSPPLGFALELYDYQKRTLNWMMRLENDENEVLEFRRFGAPDVNKEILKLGPGGCFFYPRERRFTVRNHAEGRMNDVKRIRVRGGLVLDKVGSGKTVTLLALMHSNPFKSVRNIPWKRSQDRELYLPARGTLVIVPSNLATQWSIEARRCLGPQAKVVLLTTMIQYKKLSWSDLLLADIVIVTLAFLQNLTYRARIAQIVGQAAYKIPGKLNRRNPYDTVDAEQFARELDREMLSLTCQGRSKFGDRRNCCIIERVHWHRLIIDEFHELGKNSKNVKSEEFLAQFRATFYWGVTGTPQYETSAQIDQMARYLHTTIKPETAASYQEFLNKVCRRNDPELRVPKVHYETVWVDLSANEMALYHTLQYANSLQSQLMMVNHYAITDAIVDLVGDKVMNVNQVSDILQANRAERIVALTTRIQKLDEAHPKNMALVDTWKNKKLPDDVEERGRIMQARREVNEYKPIRLEFMRELQNLKSAYTFFQGVLDAIEHCVEQTCPLCLETIQMGEEFQITNCGHVYCVECTTRLLRQIPPRCGMCRGQLEAKKVLRMKLQSPEKKEEMVMDDASEDDEREFEPDGVDFSKYGTKLKELTLYVLRVTRADPTAKIILFVQFRRLAELVYRALSEFRVPLVRCRGNVMVRNRAVGDFKTDPKIKVIMLSSEDSVSGLHLTEANYVIILHPFMADSEATALAYERQGVARAVRAGQMREVRVVRFVTRQTVEERITTRRAGLQVLEHGRNEAEDTRVSSAARLLLCGPGPNAGASSSLPSVTPRPSFTQSVAGATAN